MENKTDYHCKRIPPINALQLMDRKTIYNKYNGRCAYSGTLLEDDWQVDHLKPRTRGGNNDIENLMPTQKLINHYKRSLSIKRFKSWYMANLHTRLQKLPKNPRTEKSKKHIQYMNKIATYFNITKDQPFTGQFYYESITK